MPTMSTEDWAWLAENYDRMRNMVSRVATNLADEAWDEVLRKYPRLLELFDPDYGVPLDAYLYTQLKRYVIKWLMARSAKKARQEPLPDEVPTGTGINLSAVDVYEHLRPGEEETLRIHLEGVTAREQAGSASVNARRVRVLLNRLRLDLSHTLLLIAEDEDPRTLSLMGFKWHTRTSDAVEAQTWDRHDLVIVCGATYANELGVPSLGHPSFLEYTRKQWLPMQGYARAKLAVVLPSTRSNWWQAPLVAEFAKEEVSTWAEGERRFL